MTESVGARTSLKRMNPIMIGLSRVKPKALYSEWLLMKTEKRVNM